MTEFIAGFVARYPQFAALPLFIYGESYAGHYVPNVAAKVLRDLVPAGVVNLVGAAIGNGLTAPQEQYKWYLPYSVEHGLVDDKALQLMTSVLAICEPLIALCNTHANETVSPAELQQCLAAVAVCNLGEVTPVSRTGVNVYDVRIPCGDSKLCYDFRCVAATGMPRHGLARPSQKERAYVPCLLVLVPPLILPADLCSAIDGYLNQPDVQAALGVPEGAKWKECSTAPEAGLLYAGDWMKECEGKVTELLDGGVNVLIYAGEYDFICNWMGNNAWVQALGFNQQAAFASGANTTWTTAEGEAAGSYVSGGGLTFLKVHSTHTPCIVAAWGNRCDEHRSNRHASF
jgi:carboxypeptidase C (cathepsin A)